MKTKELDKYIFDRLYESNDIDDTIQMILDLILKHFHLNHGYIYNFAANGFAYCSFESRLPFDIPIPELPNQLSIEAVEKYKSMFEHGRIHKIHRPELVDYGVMLHENFNFRLMYTFETNKECSGFIGLDCFNPKDCDFSSEDMSLLTMILKILDVFLANRTTHQNFQDSTLLVQSLINNMDNFTYIIDPSTHVIKYMNQNTKKKFPNATLGGCCYSIFRNKNEPCEDCPITRMIEEGTTNMYSEMYFEPHELWGRVNSSLIEVSCGQQFGIFSSFDFSKIPYSTSLENEDLSDFASDTTLYNAMSQSTDDYIIMCDVATNRFFFPKKMVDEFNLPKQVIKDALPLWISYIHEDDRESFIENTNTMFSGETSVHKQEYRALNKDGVWVWLQAKGHLERDNKGNPLLSVIVLKNLGKKSKVDHLTGLLDKYEFEITTRKTLDTGVKKGALLILALDNFRYINNVYGWDFGDQVLKETASRLLSSLPDKTQLFRLDGDKFGAFFTNIELEEIETYYNTIFHMFRQQKKYGEHSYYYTISAGCAYFDCDDVDYNSLFKKASYALDCAKRDGKNRLKIYDEETMSDNEYLLQMIALLNKSVENQFQDFSLHYQPQINPKTSKITSAEALLRWAPPSLGNVSPVEFIPLLEKVGLIHKVGFWVIQHAAETCKLWRNTCENFTISVNISYAQLQDPEFLLYLKKQIKKGELDPKTLHLEITESCIADGSRSVGAIINKLRNLGFVIEMDDFGTGYSSLEILKNAPSDIVKIDRAFVKDITKSDFDATFIRFVVTLCHSVGIHVCLEGVETNDEYTLVKDMDLDLIQGYLFGRPQAKELFEKNHLLPLTEESNSVL